MHLYLVATMVMRRTTFNIPLTSGPDRSIFLKIFWALIFFFSSGYQIWSFCFVVQLLVFELHEIRVGLVGFLQMRSEERADRPEWLVFGRWSLYVGWVCGRNQFVIFVVAEGECSGRSTLVAHDQRNRRRAPTRGARVQNETERNTR